LRTSTRFFRFCVVGGVGFLVDAGVLQLLVSAFGVGLLAGRVFSYLTAATVTWSLHRKFTFGDLVRDVSGRADPKRSSVGEWLRFVVANAVGAAVNYGAYVLCVLNGEVFRTYPALAVAVGSALGLGFNYMTSRRFVFGRAARP
jgi:putative flippase GtrA